MQNLTVSRFTRKCCVDDTPFQPGERFISVLLEDNDGLRRVDYRVSNWEPENTESICWWRGKMPEKASHSRQPAPVGVLLDTLDELRSQPKAQVLAYLLAILLLRRRVLVESPSDGQEVASDPNRMNLETVDIKPEFRLAQSSDDQCASNVQCASNDQFSSDDESGRQPVVIGILRLSHPLDGRQFEVPEFELEPETIERWDTSLQEILYVET